MIESFHIPGYRVERRISSGAMGTVYRAVQVSINALRAVKVLHPHLAEDERFLARFAEEARNAAHVRGEHVVSIVDFSPDHDPPFLAMEYVDGPTLAAVLKVVRPFPVEIAVLLLHQLAKGLQAAHERHVVHRDLKPSNVLLGLSGQLKVADFGLAKSMLDAPHLTVPGQRLGTLAYMSPEQIASPRDVDFRSDLFSFGIIAYQLVTGVRPFRGNDADTIRRAILREDPVPASDRSLLVDGELSAFLEKLLDKDVSRRPERVEWAQEWLHEYISAHNLYSWNRLLPEFARSPESVSASRRARGARTHVDRAQLLMKLGEVRAREAFRDVAIALYLCPHDTDALEAKSRIGTMLRKQDISPGDIIPQAMADALEDSGVDLWEAWERTGDRGEVPVGSSETLIDGVSGDADTPLATRDSTGADTVSSESERGRAAPERATAAPERAARPRTRRLAIAGFLGGVAVASAVVVARMDTPGDGERAPASFTLGRVSPPGATLLLEPDGGVPSHQVRAGVELTGLAAGRYTLRGSHEGYRAFETAFDLSGFHALDHVSLERMHANVSVHCTPHATVSIAGRTLGTTPIRDTIIHTLGRVSISLRREGYAPRDSTIHLEDGARADLRFVLERGSSTFRVTVRADGLEAGDVSVDGALRARVALPHTFDLEPRSASYAISLSRRGWKVSPPAIAVTPSHGGSARCEFRASCSFGNITVLGGMYNRVLIDGESTWLDEPLVTPLRDLELPCKSEPYEVRVVWSDGETSPPKLVELAPGDTIRAVFTR